MLSLDTNTTRLVVWYKTSSYCIVILNLFGSLGQQGGTTGHTSPCGSGAQRWLQLSWTVKQLQP